MSVNVLDLGGGAECKWIDVIDPDEKELQGISREYNIPHQNVIDCLDSGHLPKYEKQKDYVFLIVRLFTPHPTPHAHSIQELTDKIAIFYNRQFMITVHRSAKFDAQKIMADEMEEKGDCRLANLVARVVSYALNTFQGPAFALDDKIDKYESVILLKNAKSVLLQGLYYIRRKAEVGRRLLLLSEDVVMFLSTTDADKVLVQDVRDDYTRLHALYEEILGDTNSLMAIYLSLTSQRTNEVVKILTIFSVFFMPLTFIVGIYGMNFEYMPELKQRWGYPYVMAGMGFIVVVIFTWFKKKKWL